MILVTGGTGLVGSHLLMSLIKDEVPIRAIYRSEKSLEKVKRIFALYDLDWNYTQSRIEWVKSDLLNPADLQEHFEGVDYVYHCAAMVSFNKKDRKALLDFNIEGTANIVNLCLDYNIKKLVHVSSTAAIGKSPNNGVRDESCQWVNDGTFSTYSISKYYSELEVWRSAEEGLDVIIINPSIIIGPGDWNESSSNLFLKVWKGLKYYSKGVNAFVSVNDVVDALIKLMKSDIVNERFLIIGENLTFQEVFNMIADSLGKSRPRIEVKKWMAELIWRIEAVKTFLFGKSPLVTKEAAESALSVVRYSNKRIKEEIGFNFTPVKSAIQMTGEIFRRDH